MSDTPTDATADATTEAAGEARDEARGAVQPRVHLVDASPYIFRAYFSLPDSITDPDGTPVHAVYGFASSLVKLLEAERPTHLAFCFDGSLTTSFRNEIYPEYKSSREEAPEDLKAQLERARRLAAAFGARTFIDDRYEADDLLATLLEGVRSEGAGGVVVTSDKDLAQLVDEDTVLYDFAKDDRWGPQRVVEKFGVRPGQIPDYLALAGDPVDDIPGVRGVGKKTAVALLEAFADLDDLYGRLDEVAELSIRGAGTLGKKLEEQRDMAFLSRRLARVATDAPAAASLDELTWSGVPRGGADERDGEESMEALLDELGFGDTLRQRLPWADGDG